MALVLVTSYADGRTLWSCLSSDTKPTTATCTNLIVDSELWETNTRTLYSWSGANWDAIKTAGAVVVSGLAPTFRRLTADTYSTTNTLGVRILTVGTGTLTLVPASGDTAIVITAAEITTMGTNLEITVPELSSVTAGTGMSLLLLIR